MTIKEATETLRASGIALKRVPRTRIPGVKEFEIRYHVPGNPVTQVYATDNLRDAVLTGLAIAGRNSEVNRPRWLQGKDRNYGQDR